MGHDWVKRNQANRDRYNASWRKWYRENRERKIEWQMRRREELRVWFRELKSTLSCVRCSEPTVECLQFHHRDPAQKDFEVSVMVSGYSRERILEEIAKCDVLCANCHLKHHWEERQKKES